MNAVQSWQNMLLSSLWHAHLHAKCTFLHFKGLIMRDIFLTFSGGVVVHSTELWCQQHRFSSHLVIVWMCVRMAACLYICPVTDWKPFWGFVCLLPKVIWKRLQFPITLSISEAQHFKCSGPLCEFLESLRCHGIKKKKRQLLISHGTLWGNWFKVLNKCKHGDIRNRSLENTVHVL